MARDTAGAGMITAATILEAQRRANYSSIETVDEGLADAGIDAGAARRAAAAFVALYASHGVSPHDTALDAFLCGLELGARCARLVR